MDKTKTLTSQGAAAAIPSGNAIPTVDANGKVTMVQGTVIPPTATIKSTVTPAPDTEWLRVAECDKAPYFALMSVVGVYAANHGDAFPVVISFGAGGLVNVNYISGRIATVVNSTQKTLSKVRAVSDGSKIYIDLLFAKGGGLPTINLIGAHGVKLVTPSIAPAVTDEKKTYIYELP